MSEETLTAIVVTAIVVIGAVTLLGAIFAVLERRQTIANYERFFHKNRES